MLKALAVCAAAILVAGPVGAPHGPIYAGPPPARFTGGNIARVIFTSNVEALCGSQPGYKIYACTAKYPGEIPIVVLPNPNQFEGEWFAHIVGHELGHVNGWTGEHEQ